jgi:hypothetical protein
MLCSPGGERETRAVAGAIPSCPFPAKMVQIGAAVKPWAGKLIRVTAVKVARAGPMEIWKSRP